ASAAVDHADALVAPAPTAEIDVAVAAFAVVRAGGIVAEEVSDAQARCFGHDATPWRVYSRGYDSLRRILLPLFVCPNHHPRARAAQQRPRSAGRRGPAVRLADRGPGGAIAEQQLAPAWLVRAARPAREAPPSRVVRERAGRRRRRDPRRTPAAEPVLPGPRG